jgi:hypothetical protein
MESIIMNRKSQGQIVEYGLHVKQDGNGRWGICKARRDRSESHRIELGAFIDARRWTSRREAYLAAMAEV